MTLIDSSAVCCVLMKPEFKTVQYPISNWKAGEKPHEKKKKILSDNEKETGIYVQIE